MKHATQYGATCNEAGERHLVTSVFSLPDQFDTWASERKIPIDQVQKIRNNVHARLAFAQSAIDVGYRPESVLRPKMRDHIPKRLKDRAYQEKQVDTTVVALIVRSAICMPNDVHVLVTGDSDMLPAVRMACPQYTNNVMVATTHPDEIQKKHSQTSYELIEFDFRIPPFFLQDHTAEFMKGNYVYKCGQCGKAFSNQTSPPRNARPYCRPCRETRSQPRHMTR